MIEHATLVPKSDEIYDLGSNLGTMVINEDAEDNEEDTMKRKIFISLNFRVNTVRVRKPKSGFIRNPNKWVEFEHGHGSKSEQLRTSTCSDFR